VGVDVNGFHVGCCSSVGCAPLPNSNSNLIHTTMAARFTSPGL
jgi:hypothetical protein